MKYKKISTIIAALIVQLCVGILYLWSIFKTPVIEFYGMEAASANMVQSVMMFGFVLGNLFGGILQDKVGPKVGAAIGCALFSVGIILTSLLNQSSIGLIFVTYGTLSGLGCGVTYSSALSCLIKWFPSRRGFASGLSVAAFGFSTVVFTPIVKALLVSFNDNVSKLFLTLGLIFLAVGVIASLFISLPQTESDKGTAEITTDLTPRQAVKKPSYWTIFVAMFFINATWNIICPVIVDLGIERGLSASTAALALSLTGVFSATGRLSMATVSDKIGRTVTISILSALTVISAVAMIFAQSGLFFAFVLIIAFAYGGPSATFPAMTADLCGSKHSGANYGIIMLSLGFSSLAFNGLSTMLNGATGGYTWSFIIAAVTAVIPIAMMILYNRLAVKNKTAKTE